MLSIYMGHEKYEFLHFVQPIRNVYIQFYNFKMKGRFISKIKLLSSAIYTNIFLMVLQNKLCYWSKY